MKKLNSKKVILIVVLAILLIVGIVFGYSFAYFTSSVVNDSTINNTVVTTASLEIEFSDGPKVSIENATPGQEKEKTFKVKNNSSLDTTYDIYMSEVVNTFVDKSDLVYTLESVDGGANITTETVAPDAPTKIVSSHILGGDEEHNYKLKIKFKETNDNQDDNKEKQFDVTIRINEVHDAPENAVDTITILSSSDDSLVYDNTSDNNLRYIGSNPNNYVSYNDELWRIIGVMNNMQTVDGQRKSLLKIVRNDYLGEYSWDSSASDINGANGINQWGESASYEGADLMRELNTDYLGTVTVGSNGKWYSGESNTKSFSMPASVIATSAQTMIEDVVWNTGSIVDNNGSYDRSWENNINSRTSYIRERSNYSNLFCSSGTYCNDTVTRTSTWTGKVGLMYPSDYGFATSGGSTTSRDICLTTSMYKWDNSSKSDCKDNDWLYNSRRKKWTISSNYNNGTSVILLYDNGRIWERRSSSCSGSTYTSNDSVYVYPSLYLKSSVKITGGSGTSTDPYTLG